MLCCCCFNSVHASFPPIVTELKQAQRKDTRVTGVRGLVLLCPFSLLFLQWNGKKCNEAVEASMAHVRSPGRDEVERSFNDYKTVEETTASLPWKTGRWRLINLRHAGLLAGTPAIPGSSLCTCSIDEGLGPDLARPIITTITYACEHE